MTKEWKWHPLRDLLQSTETVNPRSSPDTEFDYIDVSSVSNVTFRIEETQRLRGRDAPSRARKLVKTDDVLLATIRPTLQRVAVVPRALDGQVCSTGYFVLRPRPALHHRFLFHFLLSEQFKERMESLQKGANYPAVTDQQVKTQEIPLPPLPEQKRIVDILDEAFGCLFELSERASRSRRETAEFLVAHADRIFTQPGADWKKAILGDLAEFRNGLNFTKGSRGERVKIVGVRNFQNNFSVPMDDLDTVTIEGMLSREDALRNDDILAVRSNGNIELIGRCMLVEDVPDRTAHSGFTIRIRLSKESVLPRFLCYFLRAKSSRRKLTDGGSGTNIKSLSQGTLANLTVAIPPLQEQRRIVAALDSLTEETHRLVRVYERKSAALSAFRQSLLHHAFTGQL